MKFSNLPSLQRSLLAALASDVGSTLHTGQLAGYYGNDARRAANDLCALRDLGLVFSHQKNPGDQYAKWQISKVGMAVFEGRPDGNVLVVPAGAKVVDIAEARAKRTAEAQGKLYRVVNTDGACVESLVTDDEAAALSVLSRTAESEPGHEFRLVTTVAVALLPKPQATITRV